jgi:phenylalanyl-tRNA synthetase beta chain
MKLPLEWLHEHCNPGLDASALAERLTMTGTKVERIVHHGVAELERFVVGRVLEASRHPDADRLIVCRVAIGPGEGDVTQIVCGAPNVAAGQAVAVARPGAVMPDGTRLKRARLRGVESDGMILAEDELAIGTEHAGILVLDGDPAPGTPLADVLPIATDVLELEITPNRPDCLGVYGVAREVHAATGAPLGPNPGDDDEGSEEPVGDGVEISVQAGELCPRFTARVYEDVRIGPSPPWLKARLMAAGQRPISNIVDITNYVMLVTGQPMHAFDLDQVAGGRLVVRRAEKGERLTTLDGSERELDEEMVIICDDQGPTSLAGVMGGERSEVNDSTTRVLMEAATWVGANIQRTSTRLALRSEASARFEKGLSPEAAMEAQAVTSRLMREVCSARLVPGTIDIGGPGPEPAVLRLRTARVERLLGTAIPAARCREILESLGFGVQEADDGLDVTVPHFRRNDVTREADLIEEVARMDGVEHLPSTLPARRGAIGVLSHFQRTQRRAEDVLVGRGMNEIVGWSFTAPGLGERLRLEADDPRRHGVVVVNPMSEEQSVMRTTVLGSLLDAVTHNTARDLDDLALFESGAVYRPADGPLADEHHLLGGALTGHPGRAGWRSGVSAPADFFAVKALVETVLGAFDVDREYRPLSEPFLHPGRAASVSVAGQSLGWVGEVHPLVARAWELERTVAAFEIDLRVLADAAQPVRVYRDVISYPAVRQDIAVVVADDVSAARVLALVRESAGALLSQAEAFDVYRGDQIDPDHVSLALRLEFRAPDRTLTDDEVAVVRERITAALRDELGGELRA